MEEFNADKIMQSLVKEAGMPVELAQKITSETESRLYKFQTQYLTAPLIREMVNALLVEHNLEEYRHKLTRLGMPVFDVTQLLGQAGDDGGNVESLIHQTGSAVFSEYLLLEQLPRDVADAHLAGDIHISDAGMWGLMPDTIFVDLLTLRASGFNPKGRILYAPMIPSPENLESAVSTLANLSSLMRKEATTEIVYRNFLQYIAPFCRSRTKRELEASLLNMFENTASSLTMGERPTITFELNQFQRDEFTSELIEKALDSTLGAYRTFVESTPRPEIRLTMAKPARVDDASFLKQAAGIIFSGGRIAFFSANQRRSFLGLDTGLLPAELQADNVNVLHNLSLNLPRLAYDSNQDETYFRAKLAMLIGVASDALTTRRRIIERVVKKGLLPTLVYGSEAVTSETVPLIMNLVGLDETLTSLVKDGSMESKASVGEKIAQTGARVSREKSGKNERIGVAVIDEDGASRLASLDADKYGRGNIQLAQGQGYSQSPRLVAADLYGVERTSYLTTLSQSLDGGLSVRIDAATEDTRGIYNLLIAATSKLPFFKIDRAILVCRNCGSKLPPRALRCRNCKSTATVQYSTAE
jgi:ribonucleoside-triphosphate reductase